MKRKQLNVKKNVILIILAVFCIIFGIYAVWKVYHHFEVKKQIELRNQKGILLCFDDYSYQTWEDNFDLFDKYGVKVTFFVNLSEPTDFCAEAVERGHEIGFHTVGHVRLTEASKEEFYQQAIAPIEVFCEQGYELTTFAYPYGAYEDWMNTELLKYYKTTRGASHYMGYYKESVPGGFIEARSIDNGEFESEEHYKETIDEYLDILCGCEDGTIAVMFSHAIDGGTWCIAPERLEYLFQEAQKRGLQFYTFKDLQ